MYIIQGKITICIHMDRGRELLVKKQTLEDRESEGVKTGRNVRTPFMDGPLQKNRNTESLPDNETAIIFTFWSWILLSLC